ncbi:hypothetical protein CL618_03480 [archaeon]|nr:hypothetical protein [archaeon]|tara:strand:+ start:811 stop:1395 length:585 start_codon:yes stop_codon:yes gene_type:complete
MKKLLFLLLLFISGCFTSNIVLEGPFTVVKVTDGDTLDITNQETIRLSGINTPETGECYYQEAKDALTELTLDKDIFLEKDKTNRGKYGRLLRYIYINDLLINSYLVENGYARVYDKYAYDTKRYEELKEKEKIAISKNLGVWSCDNKIKDCLFVASKNSDKLHKPDSKYIKRIKPENLLCFKTLEEIPEKYLK